MFDFKVHWHFFLRKEQEILNSIENCKRNKWKIKCSDWNSLKHKTLIIIIKLKIFIFSLEMFLVSLTNTQEEMIFYLCKFVFSHLKGIFMSNYSLKLSPSNWVTLPQNTHPGAWLPTCGVFSGKLCFINCFFLSPSLF